MEKFGLFDLIDKFNAAARGKSEFPAEEKSEDFKGESLLKDPETTAPPQYMLNAKTLAFIRRHDELVEAIKNRPP